MIRHNIKALVVEDSNTAMLDIVSKLSTLLPIENILQSRSFSEAVQHLENYSFDVAFVDLQMPKKTGMDLILDIIHKHPKTEKLPVVVTTSMKPDSLVTHSLKASTYRYLFKPISLAELEEALDHLPTLM